MTQIITLTTDFGTRDGYVGAMKGKILSMIPKATIIDITHDIEPQAIYQASLGLTRSTQGFPIGTIHVAVIDPGVGSGRSPILLQIQEHWYIGPDNGIFTGLMEKYGVEQGYILKTETEWWQSSASFDGLSLFAPAAAVLAKGINPNELGEKTDKFVHLEKTTPQLNEHTLHGEIIAFDHFGNAITNITKEHLNDLRGDPEKVISQNRSFQWVKNYSSGDQEQAIALINSDQVIELSLFLRSAQKQFVLQIGDEVIVSSSKE